MPTIRKIRKTSNKTSRRTGSTSRSTGARNTRSSTTRTSTSTGFPISKFNTVRSNIQNRLGSFRNIYSQVSGPGKVTAFSPRTASQWFNFVNKGACVYKFSSTQLAKTFGAKWSSDVTNTTANSFFKNKFGTKSIWGVTRGRGNTWLVATNGPINKGPFKGYAWK